MRLLVTRPQPDAQRTAEALRTSGHSAIVAPLLHIEAVANVQFGAGPWAAIVVTSANAAAAIAAHERRASLLHLPAFAVGDRSAEAMRAAGFADVISAGGAVDDLVRLVAAHTKPGSRLLYLAGEDRSGDLAGNVGRHGLTLETVVLYRAVMVETLPQAALDALSVGLDGVLHFSRRSAEAYLRAAQAGSILEAALTPAHFCLSPRTAQPLQRAGARRVHVARQPDEAALIAIVESHSR